MNGSAVVVRSPTEGFQERPPLVPVPVQSEPSGECDRKRECERRRLAVNIDQTLRAGVVVRAAPDGTKTSTATVRGRAEAKH